MGIDKSVTLLFTISPSIIVKTDESVRLEYCPINLFGIDFSFRLPSGCGTSNRIELSHETRSKTEIIIVAILIGLFVGRRHGTQRYMYEKLPFAERFLSRYNELDAGETL